MGRPSKNFYNPEGVLVRPCALCNAALRLGCFYRNKDGRRLSYCKTCFSQYSVKKLAKKYYSNLSRARRLARESAKRKNLDKRNFVNSLKSSTPCEDCGRIFPAICMDFDHRRRSRKTMDVSTMVHASGFTLDRVKREIQKCRIVCACCHRLRTQKERKWRRRRALIPRKLTARALKCCSTTAPGPSASTDPSS